MRIRMFEVRTYHVELPVYVLGTRELVRLTLDGPQAIRPSGPQRNPAPLSARRRRLQLTQIQFLT